MSRIDISHVREQMGFSLGSWAVSSDMDHQVQQGSWRFLSGIPSAAVNMAMVHDDDPVVLDQTLNAVSKMRVPAVLFLASNGKRLAKDLSSAWKKITLFTLMTKELSSDVTEFNQGVSLASSGDAETVAQLLEESFSVEPGTYRFLFASAEDPTSGVDIWMLTVNGTIVSTVTTILVEDAVALWCMATPPRFERRGYAGALLVDVMARFGANGTITGLLCASPAGKSLYDSKGWVTQEEWDVYLNRAIS